jgi:hypothetical protein
VRRDPTSPIRQEGFHVDLTYQSVGYRLGFKCLQHELPSLATQEESIASACQRLPNKILSQISHFDVDRKALATAGCMSRQGDHNM